MEVFRKFLASRLVVLSVRTVWVSAGIALAISVAFDDSSDFPQRVLLIGVAALAVWFGIAAGPHPLVKMSFRRGGGGD
ncbi:MULTISPECIES: hypothetical protein [unclassified Microcoleus]|uniref:hypothetical protein n=1 Tax=unclassified Microcoleus TaxID=2642155 RepID=UPI002FD77BD1